MHSDDAVLKSASLLSCKNRNDSNLRRLLGLCGFVIVMMIIASKELMILPTPNDNNNFINNGNSSHSKSTTTTAMDKNRNSSEKIQNNVNTKNRDKSFSNINNNEDEQIGPAVADGTINNPQSYGNDNTLQNLQKIVYTCGFGLWNFTSLLLSSDYQEGGRLTSKKLEQHQRGGKHDVLVYGGMNGPCDVSMQVLQNRFQGQILWVNTEARRGSTADEKQLWSNNWYKIGPSNYSAQTHPRYLPGIYFGTLFFVSTTTTQQQNHFFFHSDSRQQPTKDAVIELYSAVVILAKCSPQRRKIVMEVSDILPVHYSPKCKVDEPNSQPIPNSILTARNSYPENYKIYKHYKYCLVLENSNTTGYITEKIFLAFMGGCIPIYWGNENEIRQIFNAEAFVFWDMENTSKTMEQLRQLATNETAYQKMLAQPILANYRNQNDIIEEYFSFGDGIGNATLKTKIRSMMGIG